jgi:hypothetical protein
LLVKFKATAEESAESHANLIRIASDRLVTLETHMQSIRLSYLRAVKNITDTVKMLMTTKECRAAGCGNTFGASLETYIDGYVKALRCKRCKCRHQIIYDEQKTT